VARTFSFRSTLMTVATWRWISLFRFPGALVWTVAAPHELVASDVVQTGLRDVDVVLVDARRLVVAEPGGGIPGIQAKDACDSSLSLISHAGRGEVSDVYRSSSSST
jgi:hypothetical protein